MSATLKIIVVEDNESLLEETVTFLNDQGWQAHGVTCGETLNHWLHDNQPDIALLDINLPYEDGLSIAQRLRQTFPDLGIVMLTARVRPSDRTAGYMNGADVYLSKPTNPDELTAVITALERRRGSAPAPTYTLDKTNKALRDASGRCCELTHSEFLILLVLALEPGRRARHDFLQERLGRLLDKPVTDDGLSVLISRLRAKCKKHFGTVNVIKAERSVGYCLMLPISLTD